MLKHRVKLIIILFLSAAPILLFGQSSERPKFAPRKDKHRNERDEFDRKQGLWKLYSASRLLIAEIEYQNDKKHGMSRRYYPHTGELMEEAEYFDGRKHGTYRKFYYTGATKMEGEYERNKRTGYWVNYYHNSGEVSSEGNYKHGRKTGDWKFYDSFGSLKSVYTYKNGTLVAKDGVSIEELKKQEKEKNQTINIK
ncbi:MAG: toxin-antitoxin system YwqK family antitoxin [Flavobacteriales bacterium]|nr:toxin-antitoxin system YwqK family antitoxin [Flavobacteriales bacterium]